MTRISLLLTVVLGISNVLPVQAAQWQFHACTDLGGDDGFGKVSQVFAVSGDGSCAVGESLATAGLGVTTGTEATLWRKPKTPMRLGTLTEKDPFSSAKAISWQGSVIVGESQTSEGMRAFRWTEQHGIESLGVLPGHDESMALGVSGDGQLIIGESSSLYEELAFRWVQGKMTPLGDLPGGKKQSIALAISADGKTIVGHSSSENGTEAFTWSDTQMVGLGSLGGERFVSRAFAVSADGNVIVGDSICEKGPQAFRWTKESGMQGLGELPGGEFQSKADGVSADGQTIVGTATSENGSEAFVWTAKAGMRSLEKLLKQQNLIEGWHLQEACCVSGDGKTIVGIGLNPKGESAGWIVTID